MASPSVELDAEELTREQEAILANALTSPVVALSRQLAEQRVFNRMLMRQIAALQVAATGAQEGSPVKDDPTG